MQNLPILALAVAIGIMSTPVADAQDVSRPSGADQLLADARELLQQGRRDIVELELRLSAEEAEVFWPVYEEYRQAVLENRNRYADMILEYVTKYRAGEVSESYAMQLVKDAFEIEQDLIERQKKYVDRFYQVLPVRKVARFYQLEHKLDAAINAELALVIPLVDPV